jgi:hypothetical protein
MFLLNFLQQVHLYSRVHIKLIHIQIYTNKLYVYIRRTTYFLINKRQI